MKAILVREFGGPGVLKLEEVPVPKPSRGQVLVRVGAAGVNPYDTYMRNGTYARKPALPYTPGSEGAGVWVPYGTAYHALAHAAKARPGETLLVHGASGGVGIAAVQFARAKGMTVFGTAGSARGLELAKREGASHVFDHTKQGYQEEILKKTAGRGVDVILEMLANQNLGQDLKLLASGGRVVVIGSRGDVTVTPRDLMARRASVHGVMLWAITEAEAKEIHAAIHAGLENGTLRPVVGKELPLAEAARAHKEVLEPGAFGKIVLVPERREELERKR